MINCTKIQQMCQKIENTGLSKKFDFFVRSHSKKFKNIHSYSSRRALFNHIVKNEKIFA
jgi:hypothetical protein